MLSGRGDGDISEGGTRRSESQPDAKKAAKILLQSESIFVVPTANQKRKLLVEFARQNLVVYGKAFDIVKLVDKVNLDDPSEIARNLNK